MIDQQAAEDKAWFNRQYYQDITKRTEIQNMLRILDENQRKADTRAEAQAAITGATPEQKLASREVNRRSFADAVADIASNASRMRDQYLRDYQGQRNRTWAQRLGMQDQLASINANAANQWSNAASNAFASGAQILGNGIDSVKASKAPANAAANETIEPIKAQAGAGQTYIEQPKAADAMQVLAQLRTDKPSALPHSNEPVVMNSAQGPVDPNLITGNLRQKLGF